jgi:hypothetical protein
MRSTRRQQATTEYHEDCKWSQRGDLNSGPTDYESVALPTELRWLG